MEDVKAPGSLNGKAEVNGKLTSENKRNNLGLRALLSVKHFAAALEKDYAKLLQLEAELQTLNLKAQTIMEAHLSAEGATAWKIDASEINKTITKINTTLSSAKEKSGLKENTMYSEFWIELSAEITELKTSSKNTATKGLALLPNTDQVQWDLEFAAPLALLIDSTCVYAESCRMLLQMIERYTPDELNVITKIIADHVPLDFTYEEAIDYQNDYYKALINFKKEFKQEKNLWDKFLDILAGGTHQSPSERVMFERWIEGEKGEL